MTESDLCKVDDQDIGHLNQCYLDSGLLVTYEHSRYEISLTRREKTEIPKSTKS